MGMINDFKRDPLKTQRFYNLSTNIHRYLCVKSLIYSLLKMVSTIKLKHFIKTSSESTTFYR